MTTRSLWRWLTWRLTQAESTVDWTEACVWDIAPEDNIMDIEAEPNIYMVPACPEEENC